MSEGERGTNLGLGLPDVKLCYESIIINKWSKGETIRRSP